jgi:hypothetical protein
MLVGCEPARLFPNTSALFMAPDIWIVPYAWVCPGAILPSWQLRQSVVSVPGTGWPDFSGLVVLVYGL